MSALGLHGVKGNDLSDFCATEYTRAEYDVVWPNNPDGWGAAHAEYAFLCIHEAIWNETDTPVAKAPLGPVPDLVAGFSPQGIAGPHIPAAPTTPGAPIGSVPFPSTPTVTTTTNNPTTPITPVPAPESGLMLLAALLLGWVCTSEVTV